MSSSSLTKLLSLPRLPPRTSRLLLTALLRWVRRWLAGFHWLLAPELLLAVVFRHAALIIALYSGYGVVVLLRNSVKDALQWLRATAASMMGSGFYQRVRTLKAVMGRARSYEEWKAAALELDVLEGRYAWKEKNVSKFYDFERIEKNLEMLRELVDLGDIEAVMRYLRSRLLRNLGGIGNKELHTHLFSGTKSLIEEYQEEVVRALKLIAEEDHHGISNTRKLAFFNETRHAFGRSALLLSGGATLGMYHAGVIKCLQENGLLPKVISGSSAGSIFCGFVGTKTDEELMETTRPGGINLDFFPKNKGAIWRRLYRFFKDGVLMDVNILQEAVRKNLGDYTFAEAYAKTGRVINIIISPPSDSKELPVLLNYLSAPDVLIWSAAVASCAIPFIYSPVELMCKDIVTGEIVPYYTEGVKWWDGSMSADLPMQRLSELFNVNHFIVSQVNPHVVPFVFPNLISTSQSAWFHHLVFYLGAELRSIILNWYEAAINVFPSFKPLADIANQKYSGDITLYPAVELKEFALILTNPTDDRFQACLRKAEIYTFRQLSMIQNHCAIEFALDECVRHVRAKMILRQEIPLSSDESHPRGEGQPTEFLVSRVRSWSSEQFNLLNRALQDQNRTGLRTPPPSVKSSRDIRMTSSLKHPKLDKISPMENEIRDSVQEVKQLAKLPRSLSITELSGSDAIPPMP